MNDAHVTDPSHHAIVRTPSAPMQPATATSGSLNTSRTVAQNRGSTSSVS